MASDLLETFELESRCLIKSSSRIFAKEYVEDGVPFFRSKDVIDKALGVFSGYDLFISRERYEELKKSHGSPSKGDLLISSVGNRSGQPYVVQDEGDFYFKDGNIIWISNFKDIDSNFLAYWFKSNIGQSRLASVMIGSAQKALTINSIRTLTVTFPIFANQKAIAHILGSLDDKIELNRQMNETREAMAQALFKSWFVDFDPVIDNALAAGNAIPDEFIERAEQRKAIEKKDNSDIQALFPDEFEFTEEMGWIPKGWTVSNVGTEFDVTMGQSPPGSTYNELEEGIYFFQGSTDFGFRYPTPRIYCTEPKRLANKRDTLVSVRAPVGDTNLAAVDCCIGRGLAALRHKSGSASFTYYAMLQLKENFKIYEGEGTVFGSINQKDFKNLIQLKSPEILISEFEINAGALDSKIELNSLNIIALAKLRDTLLPKLMSGELRIPDAAELVDEAI